ncbi:MAG: hypothetical protein SWQ30_09765 [Thermodesulfobacteriota bacterium]|nr:hypothetical protein [Thermodesulfobacteriota bacterium]
MKEEIASITHMIVDVLSHLDDQGVLRRIRDTVRDLCNTFPVYEQNHIENVSEHPPVYSHPN